MQTSTSNAFRAPSPPELGPPFRWSRRGERELPVDVSGTLPSWLQGQLLRTAPAAFSPGGFVAQHWFDAQGLVYGFEFGPGVRFKQRLLASRHLAALERGENRFASFGTDLSRSFFRRLVEPIPQLTDNANVNIVPWQGRWLAMTEAPDQHQIDPDTLASVGVYQYEDELPGALIPSAHPHYDATGAAMVNVGSSYGAKSELLVFRQGRDSHRRELEGRLPLKRLPYVHSFGLTARHAVIIDQPLTVNPVRMLFSNKAFIRHFQWRPERGSRLWKLDRTSGAFSAYEADALFCFHTVNSFEDGADLVMDFIAFDDPSVIDALYVDALARGLPELKPRLLRARLARGEKRASIEPLSDARFDFPQINYRHHHGLPYRYVWGTSIGRNAEGRHESVLHKVDVSSGEALSFTDPAFTYGEPVFVPRPGASTEDGGVLLAVGSHVSEERSRLLVVDAARLTPVASCEVALSIPLGFHGTFSHARA
jgi:beta,beta-carotene 9',10'-dioxygenase